MPTDTQDGGSLDSEQGPPGRPSVMDNTAPGSQPPVSAGNGPGSDPVPRGWIVAVAAIIFSLGVVALITLIEMWPAVNLPLTNQTVSPSRVRLLAWSVDLERDQAIFVAVAIAGALGGLVHTIRSFAWYVGNRQLKYSWLLFYLTIPLVGALLATIFLVVLRGGLIAGSSSNDVNVWGFVAIAALVGLFATQAAEKLREVFSTLFSPAQKGADSTMPLVSDTEPKTGSI